MAVVKVKKATIVAEKSAQAKLLEALQALGTFELTDMHDAIGDISTPGVTDQPEPDSGGARVSQALDILKQYEKPRSGLVETFVDVKYLLSLAEYRELISSDYTAAAERAIEMETRLTALREDRKRVEALVQLLDPLKDLPIPFERLGPTQLTMVSLGSVPANEMPALKNDLAAVDEAHAEVVGQDSRSTYLLLVHLRDDGRVPQIAGSHGFVPAVLPGLTGLPVHCLRQASDQLAARDAEIADTDAKLRAMAADGLMLKTVHDHFKAIGERNAAGGQIATTPHLVVIEGWIVDKKAEALKAAAGAAAQSCEVFISDPEPTDSPPTHLENPSWSEPFQFVTKIYGAPAYTEMDPTPWLAPFFALFFGTALGDAGYGLLLAVFFWIGLRKWKKLTQAGKRMNRLMIVIGLVSVVVGVVTGGFFADLTKYLPIPGLDALRNKLVLLDPLANPLGMMIVTLGMGVLQVYTGVIAKFVGIVKGGSWKDAFLDAGTWLLYIGGFVLMALASFGVLPKTLAPVFKYIGLAGVTGILLFAGRASRNIFARLGTGLWALYGTVGYMADVLSYTRLLALGLAGSVIGLVINQLGFMVAGVPILGIPIVIAILAGGHAFNIGISAFGAFIHCARLQFVEFFTKFYSGGGHYLKPFRWNGRYTLIKEYTE